MAEKTGRKKDRPSGQEETRAGSRVAKKSAKAAKRPEVEQEVSIDTIAGEKEICFDAGSVEMATSNEEVSVEKIPIKKTDNSEPISEEVTVGDSYNPETATSDPSATNWTPRGGQDREGSGSQEGRRRSGEHARADGTGPESASELTAVRLLHSDTNAPVGGWRRFVYNISFGLINPGDSPEVRRERAQRNRIEQRLDDRTRYVAVLSRKGGVGKTTMTTLLGLTLSNMRGDRVIAVDANPDRGTLSDRNPGGTRGTTRQLVQDRYQVNTFGQLANYVSRDGSRLDVLASETDPAVAEAFSYADYRAVTDLLSKYYSIIITDSGTGMIHSVMRGTLEQADCLVLVAGASVDEARLTSETISWLQAHGYQDLVEKSVVVINQGAGDRPADFMNELRRHFESRVKSVVVVPYDTHLSEGALIDYDKISDETYEASRELADEVMTNIHH